jgi:hypothetical protein
VNFSYLCDSGVVFGKSQIVIFCFPSPIVSLLILDLLIFLIFDFGFAGFFISKNFQPVAISWTPKTLTSVVS